MKKTQPDEKVVIKPPNIHSGIFRIQGTTPYVQLRFSEKARNQMMEKMQAGSQANKKKNKEARDFYADFLAAQHISEEGWHGIPAAAFRNGIISACRLTGFKMTIAKLSVFVQHDGLDKVDGIPLIKFEGTPEQHIMHARNATGVCDLRVRAKFWPWSADLALSWDGDQFAATDVTNLLLRVGMQVGIGEGRHDSKSPSSGGMGWGTFEIVKG